MEFKVVQKELELKSRGWIPTFHDVSKEVLEIVKESGVKKRYSVRRVSSYNLFRHDSGSFSRSG